MAQRFLVYKDSSVHIPFGRRQPCEVGMQVLLPAPLPGGGDRGPAGSSAGMWVEPAGDGAEFSSGLPRGTPHAPFSCLRCGPETCGGSQQCEDAPLAPQVTTPRSLVSSVTVCWTTSRE